MGIGGVVGRSLWSGDRAGKETVLAVMLGCALSGGWLVLGLKRTF